MSLNVADFIGYLSFVALFLGIALLSDNAADVTFVEGVLVSLVFSPFALALSVSLFDCLRHGPNRDRSSGPLQRSPRFG